jgi:hypothetical protein
VRLATDPEGHAALSRLIGERAERLYRDRAPVEAVEAFLETAAQSHARR